MALLGFLFEQAFYGVSLTRSFCGVSLKRSSNGVSLKRSFYGVRSFYGMSLNRSSSKRKNIMRPLVSGLAIVVVWASWARSSFLRVGMYPFFWAKCWTSSLTASSVSVWKHLFVSPPVYGDGQCCMIDEQLSFERRLNVAAAAAPLLAKIGIQSH